MSQEGAMSRNGHIPEYRRFSEQQLNAEALAHRDVPNRVAYERSMKWKERRASDRPRTFGKLLDWYRREWNAEFPRRLHERGVEPDSQLGAPRLAGAMRARFAALDNHKLATATDYDSGHDTWNVGSAPRFPILDALVRYSDTAPLLARYLEALAYGGFDWRLISMRRLRILDGAEFVWDQHYAQIVTVGALDALWQIWSEGQRNVGKDVA
jgi:hypothetical protein